MKKSIPKGDKKRKKDVTAEISRLELEMEERHKRELECVETDSASTELGQTQDNSSAVVEHLAEQLEAVKVGGGGGGGGGNGEEEGDQKPVKKSRAQKRKVSNHVARSLIHSSSSYLPPSLPFPPSLPPSLPFSLPSSPPLSFFPPSLPPFLPLSSLPPSLSYFPRCQEKKALQEQERRERMEEEERAIASEDNPRLKEKEKLEVLLEPLNLTVQDIQPDGNWYLN